jgi:hypothetical protein
MGDTGITVVLNSGDMDESISLTAQMRDSGTGYLASFKPALVDAPVV